jgi:Na+/H+ antiporter NhaC
MDDIVMVAVVSAVAYFIGYFNGRRDGTDWAVQQVREINGDLKVIYKLMEEQSKNIP